ncbi:MAG: NAD(+)/NADH kinase [Bacillota bacterium]
MRLGIIGNRNKDPEGIHARRVVSWLEERGIGVFVNDELADKLDRSRVPPLSWPELGVAFVVVLGGDGTLLRAARNLAHLRLPMLGVNLGHLGFLTEVETADLYEVLPEFLDGHYTEDSRHFIEASVRRSDEVIADYLALNDVVIGKGSFSRMVNIRTWVDGALMASFPADGLILSTATGSTAYSLSAGGPVIHPELEVMLITPVCPHSFFARPVLVSRDQVVQVRVEVRHRGVPSVTVDGNEGRNLKPGEHVEVRLSDRKVTLMRRKNWNFYEVLHRKLAQSEGAQCEPYDL